MSWFDVCLLMTRLKVLSTVLVFSLLDVWPQKTAAKVQRRGGGEAARGFAQQLTYFCLLPLAFRRTRGSSDFVGGSDPPINETTGFTARGRMNTTRRYWP